jgi:acyl carrier protein
MRILSRDAFREWFAETVGVDTVLLADDTLLIEELGLDSLRMVEVWLALSEAGASVRARELESIRTFGSLYDLYAQSSTAPSLVRS